MRRVDEVRSRRRRAQLVNACVLLSFGVFMTAAAVSPSTRGNRPLPPAPMAGSAFARAVAIAGNYAFVGEPGTGGGRGQAATGGGIVHVYRREATGWKLMDKLIAADSTTRDGFGVSLAAEGNTLLVGHVRGIVVTGGRGRGGGGGGGGGAGGAEPAAAPPDATVGTVSVYRLSGNRWTAAGTLPGGQPGAQFGASLAIRGNVALVGAPAEAAGGAVYLFTRGANGQWSAAGTLPNPAVAAGDRFGAAVAIDGDRDGDRIVVGAPGREAKGAVYL